MLVSGLIIPTCQTIVRRLEQTGGSCLRMIQQIGIFIRIIRFRIHIVLHILKKLGNIQCKHVLGREG